MFKWIVLCAVVLSPLSGRAQSAEYRAQFVLKTIEFMKWNGAKGEGDIVIGVVGDPVFEQTLSAQTIGLRVREKSVLVRAFKVEELSQFNLVYVVNASSKQMHNIITGAPAVHTVVITHDEGQLTEGAFVKLMPAGEKYRFSMDERKFAEADVLVSPVFQRLSVKNSLK